MKLAHVFAVIENESRKEGLIYLGEDDDWTHDLQQAKVCHTDDMDEIAKLEDSLRAMAWSVLVHDDGTIESLSENIFET